MDRQFVFVCGCARSGTSTMADLLRSHAQIALGRERYNNLFKRDHRQFVVDLFERDRFCQRLLTGDSHHRELDPYYSDIYDRWEKCTHFGDKIPSMYRHLDYVRREFKDCRIIFLVRNIFEVARSFERRRLNSLRSNDPWPIDRGVKDAVNSWNTSLSNYLAFAANYNTIMAVDYSALYENDLLLWHIFHFLGLKVSDSVYKHWQTNRVLKKELAKKQSLALTLQHREHIGLHADFISYDKVVQQARLALEIL